MSGCRHCCHDKQFHCSCHPKRSSVCKCQRERKLIKDCICVEWSVPTGETQTIYQSGGLRRIFASGYITVNSDSSDYVIVRFYLDDTEVGMPMRVFEDSSLAFSLTRFNRITVECAGENNLTEVCEGEISIILRTFME